MKSTGRGLVTVAALLAGMAQAQDCREQLPQILASAYGAAPPVALEQVICKVWPARSELTLVAVPLLALWLPPAQAIGLLAAPVVYAWLKAEVKEQCLI